MYVMQSQLPPEGHSNTSRLLASNDSSPASSSAASNFVLWVVAIPTPPPKAPWSHMGWLSDTVPIEATLQ